MQNLPQRIAAQKTALTQLREALQLAIEPPTLKIDKSEYPALDRVQALLKSARSAEESKALVACINSEILVEEEAIAQLEVELSDAQARLAPQIAEAQQLAAEIHSAYASYLEAIGKLYSISQNMAADRALVYGETATPLVIGTLDRNTLPRCLGFVASDDGEVKAALDLFSLEF